MSNINRKKRVICYIDGFNLYHAIDDTKKHYLKWVDLYKLYSNFIDISRHEIYSIKYFTAINNWNHHKQARQSSYLAALASTGVKIIKGEFQKNQITCNRCKYSWIDHEEKKSDVNLAVTMVHDAIYENIQEIFITCRDKDLEPAIELIKRVKSNIVIKSIAPPGRALNNAIAKACHTRKEIKEVHLERCLFPASIVNAFKEQIAERPTKYTPPDYILKNQK